ncbi:Hypothetical cytosolic protein [Lacticaseibacillus paracasei]|nr:Hypothetical cytosolic protein [Lacticaseibacillus paracasei]
MSQVKKVYPQVIPK